MIQVGLNQYGTLEGPLQNSQTITLARHLPISGTQPLDFLQEYSAATVHCNFMEFKFIDHGFNLD